MKKKLTGPRGIILELDSAEIYPDDPGQDGSPPMITCGWSSLGNFLGSF